MGWDIYMFINGDKYNVFGRLSNCYVLYMFKMILFLIVWYYNYDNEILCLNVIDFLRIL